TGRVVAGGARRVAGPPGVRGDAAWRRNRGGRPAQRDPGQDGDRRAGRGGIGPALPVDGWRHLLTPLSLRLLAAGRPGAGLPAATVGPGVRYPLRPGLAGS